MEQRQILHILERTSRLRAEQARLVFEMGHHCEVYADLAELIARTPDKGILIVRDETGSGLIEQVLRGLAERGLWLPLVATSEDPHPGHVVAAIKAGALDYLSLPLTAQQLGDMIWRIAHEAEDYREARRRMIEARNRIAKLSPRESEVLDGLSSGRNNRLIARELEISPRTVETHRANMMAKLGAHHSAEAVRLRLEANLEQPRLATG